MVFSLLSNENHFSNHFDNPKGYRISGSSLGSVPGRMDIGSYWGILDAEESAVLNVRPAFSYFKIDFEILTFIDKIFRTRFPTPMQIRKSDPDAGSTIPRFWGRDQSITCAHFKKLWHLIIIFGINLP